jgi:hypothetical protein
MKFSPLPDGRKVMYYLGFDVAFGGIEVPWCMGSGHDRG